MSAAGGEPGPVAPRTTPWFLPLGFAIGFAGALCGIGGGIFAGPLLHGVSKLPLRRAAATALLVVLATTTAATAAEFARADSELDWRVTAALTAGALLGAELGFRLHKRLNERTLKALFVVVLALAGLRVLFFSSALAGGLDPGPRAGAAIAFAIGLFGGALTPLLGVAGGIAMVPALFLAFASLGFGGARACALAAGAAAAVRSLWLHARAGNVNLRAGAALALGALPGAFAGTAAAHLATFAHGGRALLGVLLLVQSARFARELFAARAAGG